MVGSEQIAALWKKIGALEHVVRDLEKANREHRRVGLHLEPTEGTNITWLDHIESRLASLENPTRYPDMQAWVTRLVEVEGNYKALKEWWHDAHEKFLQRVAKMEGWMEVCEGTMGMPASWQHELQVLKDRLSDTERWRTAHCDSLSPSGEAFNELWKKVEELERSLQDFDRVYKNHEHRGVTTSPMVATLFERHEKRLTELERLLEGYAKLQNIVSGSKSWVEQLQKNVEQLRSRMEGLETWRNVWGSPAENYQYDMPALKEQQKTIFKRLDKCDEQINERVECVGHEVVRVKQELFELKQLWQSLKAEELVTPGWKALHSSVQMIESQIGQLSERAKELEASRMRSDRHDMLMGGDIFWLKEVVRKRHGEIAPVVKGDPQDREILIVLRKMPDGQLLFVDVTDRHGASLWQLRGMIEKKAEDAHFVRIGPFRWECWP